MRNYLIWLRKKLMNSKLAETYMQRIKTVRQTEEMLKNSNGKFNGKDKKLASTYMERIVDVRKMSSRLAKLLKFLPAGL